MAKFKVTEVVPALVRYTRIVEAENEEEAVEKALNQVKCSTNIEHTDDGEIEVEEVK